MVQLDSLVVGADLADILSSPSFDGSNTDSGGLGPHLDPSGIGSLQPSAPAFSGKDSLTGVTNSDPLSDLSSANVNCSVDVLSANQVSCVAPVGPVPVVGTNLEQVRTGCDTSADRESGSLGHTVGQYTGHICYDGQLDLDVEFRAQEGDSFSGLFQLVNDLDCTSRVSARLV